MLLAAVTVGVTRGRMTGTLGHTRANIRQRVDNYEDDRPFQHPARRAAMAARNAVAAEMAVAGRAGHTHLDPCWGEARTALLEPGDATWVLASDAYSQMREDLNCLWPTPAEALNPVPVTAALSPSAPTD